MNDLISDIYTQLCAFMSNVDKLNFLSVSKKYHAIKNLISFDDEVYMADISHLWYYNSFFNVRMCNAFERDDLEICNVVYPKNIRRLTLHNYRRTINIPSTVTDLKYIFRTNYISSVYVPNGVVYLKFDCNFTNGNIYVDHIPSTVTHLTICYGAHRQSPPIKINGDHNIKKYIPKSVTNF